MNNQKGFVVPLVLAILTLVAAGGFAYESRKGSVSLPTTPVYNVYTMSTSSSPMGSYCAPGGMCGGATSTQVSSTPGQHISTDAAHGFSILVSDQATVSQNSLGQYISGIPFVSVSKPNNNATKTISVLVNPGKCDAIPDPTYQMIDGTNFTIQPWGDQGNANTWTALQSYWGQRGNECYEISAIISGSYSSNVPVSPNYDLIAEQADLEKIASSLTFMDSSTAGNDCTPGAVCAVDNSKGWFSVSPSSGQAPLTVTFKTVETAGSQIIDYGDGSSCTDSDPSGTEHCNLFTHTYVKPGTYTAIFYRLLPYTELATTSVVVTSTSSTALLQACPSEEVLNQMPTVSSNQNPPSSYYIFNGQRYELSEFDQAWVSTNCTVPTQTVY